MYLNVNEFVYVPPYLKEPKMPAKKNPKGKVMEYFTQWKKIIIGKLK